MEQGDDDAVLEGVRNARSAAWDGLRAAVDRLMGEDRWVTRHDAVVQESGIVTLGWPEYSRGMVATEQALYAVGAVSPAFDWDAWRASWGTPDAARVAAGSAADAVRYLTSVVRGERFGDGALDRAMQDGTLPAALTVLLAWHDEETGRG